MLFEGGHAPVDQDVVEVFTTEMGVTIGGLDLENTVLNGEERHIESATSEIEDENVLLTLSSLIKTVCDCGGSRLVDDALHVETSNGAGVFCSLSLRVVEVSRDCDDRGGDRLAQVSFSNFLHLYEDHGGDLFCLVLFGLAFELDNDQGLLVRARFDLEGPEGNIFLNSPVAEFAANEAFGVEDCVGWVTSCLVLGGITDKTLFFCEGNIGGSSVDTLVIGDDFDLVVLPHAYT